MIFTNKTNLPPAVVNLLTYAGYEPKGDISVTRLIKPPRIVTLAERHKDEIKVDVQDLAWSALGQAVHVLLERSAGKDVIVEQRLHTQIYGWDVNGQPDIWYPTTKEMQDYKVTSVWSFIFAAKPEWEKQLNLNAMLHRLKGQEVENIKIIAFLRDWMQRKAQMEKDYPQHQIHVVGQPLWDQDKCIDYAEERTKLHQDQRTLPDEELTLCSPEERWYRTGGWPVIKNGNKKADKVFPTEAKANEYVSRETINLKAGRYFEPVMERKGENVRCLNYCEVRNFCAFGRQVHAEFEAARLKPISAPKFESDTEEATE